MIMAYHSAPAPEGTPMVVERNPMNGLVSTTYRCANGRFRFVVGSPDSKTARVPPRRPLCRPGLRSDHTEGRISTIGEPSSAAIAEPLAPRAGGARCGGLDGHRICRREAVALPRCLVKSPDDHLFEILETILSDEFDNPPRLPGREHLPRLPGREHLPRLPGRYDANVCAGPCDPNRHPQPVNLSLTPKTARPNSQFSA